MNTVMTTLMSEVLRNESELSSKVRNTTAEEYANMSPADKLMIHVAVGLDEEQFNTFFDRVRTFQTKYSYRYSDGESTYLFRDSKELANQFGMSVSRIWREYKLGNLPGELEKINEIHYVDSDNNTVKIERRKVYQPLSS